VDNDSAEVAVRNLYTRLIDSWNHRDARTFAELFTDDGTSIGFDGSQATTPVEIRSHLAPIFADHPTAAYVAKVRTVRTLGESTVMLRAIVGMLPPGQRELNPEVNATQTLIAERQDGNWRIVLFQNTPSQYHGRPELTKQHTAELQEQLRSDTYVA
jgi:uncharacterized protein (TIGR02246 family)